MIVDQLFTPKPLEEGGPYDLPGIDYPRSGDTPPKRRSAPSDYPYSKEQDDDYFREIFRKKREAAKKAEQDKEQGVAEGVDQVKKVFKDKSGKPVGEIGIDPESSPGNGEWYVHHYATGYSVVGFDSAAEAKRELLYVHKHPDAVEGHPSTTEQGVAEGEQLDELSLTQLGRRVSQGVGNIASRALTGAGRKNSPTRSSANTQAQGAAQRLMPFNNINPKTGQRWTVDEIEARQAERNTPITAPVAATTTTTAATGGPGFNAGNVMSLPGMEKYAKKTATPPAKTPNFAGPTGYGKTTTSFKQPGTTPAPTTAKLPAGGGAGVKAAGGLDKKTLDYINAINAKQPESMAEAKQIKRITNALTKPVAEMLQMVKTKEDVQRIKKFIDDTFVKHGAVNESAFAVRNQLIEHVTQTGAQRRREHARKS